MYMADFETTGIIPTRVGTRKKYLRELVQIQDHPHACGDKFSFLSSSGT